ncbi:Planctomycete cytochrome C [Roseimaritima multifibrata]|uniref:Planctomycete cytochrome C n=1 Tax=Roseimaritima multifibrata TaxID=1930274 RepID=A0A517MKE4_9BACT|nr:PSD1 and planctomycete cytochrome C domain-containing protein [Roseimaritima multifibrata]QDS95356.1 Planctomycete cytochrome C [Roseimaritima multifibrata]
MDDRLVASAPPSHPFNVPMLFSIRLFCGAITILTAFASSNSAFAEVDFTREVQPILAKHCYACHGPDIAESGLSFVDRESALAESESGEHAIVPGDTELSMLVARISSGDEFERMPPEGDPLSPDEIKILSDWIDEGAEWSDHWAFVPMKRVEVPQIDNPEWSANPIDAFVYDRLAKSGLAPNPSADKRTLIRRAYYDLIGLPPTVEQIEAFLADTSADAYPKLIDELLESPHYGERWGRHWLDLVRYGETNSFERDSVKPNAWKYRDYVIESFNEDKPYDQFIREQLAGDELDEVTRESLIATGYYRLGIWDDEPADRLLARYDELDDLITTTGQVFLGLTINCARCHDHKIDPIPQKDYYAMVAFFGDVTPYGNRGDERTNNQIDLSSPELRQAYAESDRRIAEIEKAMHAIEQDGISRMSAPDQRATEGPAKERRQILKANLKKNLSDEQWTKYTELKETLASARKQRQSLAARETAMGLASYRSTEEPTRLLFRGNPHSPADEVGIGFPKLFNADEPAAPTRGTEKGSAGRRRILADWIASKENMMTSRVMANRVWQFHFGRGIVRSTSNFGQLGTPPTHPKLFEWLAFRLMDEDWKLKPLHRLIMTSRTYQMSSQNRDDAIAVDPNNDLFWRFDRRRLSAEEVRDSILAVNGSLNRKLYGESVFPKISDEVLAGQSVPGKGWNVSSPEESDRRSIYVHVKRSLLLPLLTAFDYPEPDRTCDGRFATLQPGQALSLLNSDFIHAESKILLASIGGSEQPNEAIVRKAIQSVLSRQATDIEIAEGSELIEALAAREEVSRERATQLYCLSVINWNEFLFLD